MFVLELFPSNRIYIYIYMISSNWGKYSPPWSSLSRVYEFPPPLV